MVKAFETSQTATVALKKYAKNIQVSTSCRLLRSVSMRTSSKTST